jgi:SAM-dependent methyltransferase
MLELASQDSATSTGISLLRGDIRELPLANASCGAIWCSTVLPHLSFEDLAGALSEFRRVLQPDGLLVATFKVGIGEGLEVAEDLLGVSRWIRYTHEAELRRTMDTAGFEILEFTEWNEANRFSAGRDLDFISLASRIRKH